MLVFEYQLNVSHFYMHYIWECVHGECILGVACEYTWRVGLRPERAPTTQWVRQAVQPVDQVNPSSRRDTTECDWAGAAGTVALTLMKHARVPRHTLLEMVRRQVGPPYSVRWHCRHTQQALMGALHGHVRWAVSSHHALGEECEERTTTNPCISDMQLTLKNNMHYYCTQWPLSHMYHQT